MQVVRRSRDGWTGVVVAWLDTWQGYVRAAVVARGLLDVC